MDPPGDHNLLEPLVDDDSSSTSFIQCGKEERHTDMRGVPVVTMVSEPASTMFIDPPNHRPPPTIHERAIRSPVNITNTTSTIALETTDLLNGNDDRRDLTSAIDDNDDDSSDAMMFGRHSLRVKNNNNNKNNTKRGPEPPAASTPTTTTAKPTSSAPLETTFVDSFEEEEEQGDESRNNSGMFSSMIA
jgi:hypothetical protein